jgi:hypothetical protein
MPLTLPREPVPAKDGSPKILIVYGLPKIGKTPLVATLPNLLLLDIDKPHGSDYVTCMKMKLDNALQIPEVARLVAAAQYPYKYLALDTLDSLEDWAESEGTRLYKASIIGKNFNGDSILELPKGAGYQILRNVYRKLLSPLLTLAPYIILIGHVRDKDLDTGGAATVSVKALDLTGKLRTIVCGMACAIGHMYRDKQGTPIIDFNTTEETACGVRCKHLIGKQIKFSNPYKVEDWKQIYTDL